MSTNNLVCALSGQTPIQDPVVTPTGQICSKKLLLQKLIETNYMNPFTPSDASSAMPLEESQLVEIQTEGGGVEQNIVPPKPTSSNSIPSILNTLSSEYDALVLELYDTRKALEETRKELSVALYQNDAAIRVIARVVLERDVARRELAEAVANGGVNNKRKRDESAGAASSPKKVNVVEEDNDVQMKDGGDNQIPTTHSKKLQDKWTELCKGRKAKTKAGPNYASMDAISKFTSAGKRYHKSNNKGISSLVAPVASTDDKPVIVSCGKSDKQLIWYNPTEHKIEKSVTLKKGILNSECLSTYNDVTAAVTEDYILNVYSGEEGSGTLVLDNDDTVVGVEVHPTCEHVFVTTESGKTHIVYVKEDGSLESVTALQCLDGDDVKCTCMGLHPDGLIMALGRNDGKVTVWDLKTEKLASTFEVSNVVILILAIYFLTCWVRILHFASILKQIGIK